MRSLLLVLFALSSASAQDTKPIAVKATGLPGGVTEVKLVDRDQLRAGAGTKRLSIDKKTRLAIAKSIPVPATYDWTKNNTVPFPMLGNDQYGDCYYVTICKLIIAFNANATGKDVLADFPTSKVVSRYLQVAGGDNGMYDSQVFTEMKGGIIGPKGPHKWLDIAVVSSTDQVAIALCQYAFGPMMYTFSVPGSVMNNLKGGVLWDTQTGGYVGGHAVPLTGKNSRGNYSLQTWAIQPPVEVTPRFIANNDPELIATFCLEWFDAKGYAPNGFHYETLAPLWTSLTGGALPASPFPPPVGPTPPPIPVNPGKVAFGWADLNPDAQARLKAAGVTSFDLHMDLLQPASDPFLLADYAAVLAHVKSGKKAYLTIGPTDTYAGSTTDYHARIDSLGTFAPGVYLCYLGTDGKPMIQRLPDPAPVTLRSPMIRRDNPLYSLAR